MPKSKALHSSNFPKQISEPKIEVYSLNIITYLQKKLFQSCLYMYMDVVKRPNYDIFG